MCRYGLHHSAFSKAVVKRVVRSWRQEVRIKLKMGDYDNISENRSVPYTD